MKNFLTILAVLAILWGVRPTSDSEEVVPPNVDPVSEAIARYESNFRTASGMVADELESGQLKTDWESRDRREALLKDALKDAFLPLAEREAEQLSPWSAEAEIRMLRTYEINQ